MLELIRQRLFLAFSTWPDVEGWLFTLGLLALFAFATLIILHFTKLSIFSLSELPRKHLLLLGIIAIFTPSLPEETLYRVLLLPHSSEAAGLNSLVLTSMISLFLYVVAHPLLALVAWPWSRRIFYRPAFLLIVALLGIACTLAYLRTGSVWASTFIHWATIVGWKLFFGGPDFNLGKRA